jgi:hypothetical protein
LVTAVSVALPRRTFFVGGLLPDEGLRVVFPVLCPEVDRSGEGVDAVEHTIPVVAISATEY